MITDPQTQPVLYFDGVCKLCNRAFVFVLKHDKKKVFKFATLQSPPGEAALKHVPDAGKINGSLILFSNGKYYTRSSAALHVFKLIGGGYSALYFLIVIPQFIRDSVYNLIARKRYTWFGKAGNCLLPTPEIADRFL